MGSIKIIKEISKEEFRDYLYNIDIRDNRLYEEVMNSGSIGIFQFNGNTASKLIKEIAPANFEEMTAVNALSRPGPIDVAAPYYVERKNGAPSPYPEQLNEILEETHDTIIFQEQIMSIFNKIGGFTLIEADSIRGLMKILSKAEKKQSDINEWEEAVSSFIKGAKKKGIKDGQAKRIASDIMAFSSYSFNKCFSGDCRIDNSNKIYLTIEEMYKTKNDYKWAKDNGHKHLNEAYKNGYGNSFSLDEKDLKLYENNIIDIYDSGKQEVFKITTLSSTIEVSKKHKFPINKEIVEKSIETGLKIGDFLYVNVDKKNTKLDKIISIESLGIKQTYDVEMKAPYHTLSVNKIIASNSHAVSYTYIALMTLYLSFYFRKFFYGSILNYEISRDKDVIFALNSVKTQGFDILPPDINKSKYNMSIKEDKILFGFNNIKFVGDKPIEKIIQNRPFSSLFDFIIKTRSREVSSKVIKALISVGSFDEINPERKKLLWIFEKFWANKKTIKIEKKLKFIWDSIEKESERTLGLKLSKTDFRRYEKDFLGFNFFTSMFDKKTIKALLEMKKRHLINFSFDEITDLSKKIPVCINSFRTLIDKNGNQMAFLDAEDPNGAKETIPVFSSYWKYVSEKFEYDEIYLINVYKKDGSILFGQKAWETSGAKIKRMVKKIQ